MPGDIATLRLLLAPGCDFPQHSQLAAPKASSSLDPTPEILHVGLRSNPGGESSQFLLHPGGSAGRLEFRPQPVAHREQVSDVVERVVDLFLTERPAGPVGIGLGAAQGIARQACNEAAVANAVAVAEERGGDLGVEMSSRQSSRLLNDDLQIL